MSKKLIAVLASLMAFAVMGQETGEDWAKDRAWFSMTDEQRYEASTDLKARAVGLTEDEYF